MSVVQMKKEINLNPSPTKLTSYTKINSKYLVHLNGNSESIKVLEDSIGEYPQDFELSKSFLNKTQKH